jgi:hypothetical protein
LKHPRLINAGAGIIRRRLGLARDCEDFLKRINN